MDGGVPLTFDPGWLEQGRGARSSPGLPANSSVLLGSGDPSFRRADRGAGPRPSALCFEVLFRFFCFLETQFYFFLLDVLPVSAVSTGQCAST